jgi:hypothetical protein
MRVDCNALMNRIGSHKGINGSRLHDLARKGQCSCIFYAQALQAVARPSWK